MWKTSGLEAPGFATPPSVHWKAVPENPWNHACSCGYEEAGCSWRWRCGPVASPVWPTRPTESPAFSSAPGTTAGSRYERWQYVHVWPSVVRSEEHTSELQS